MAGQEPQVVQDLQVSPELQVLMDKREVVVPQATEDKLVQLGLQDPLD